MTTVLCQVPLLRILPLTNFILDHEIQFLHGPSRPLSPPTTPLKRKTSFGPITPASSSRKLTSKRRDSHQLPTEVLQLCQQRVEALLRQNRSHRQTIDHLRHSEVSLHRIVERQEEELQSLDTARLKYENELRIAQSKISSAREEIAHLQSHIQQLEKDKTSATDAIHSHEIRVQFLEVELGNATYALDNAQAEKRDLQLAHLNASRDLKDIKEIQASLKDEVHRHEEEFDILNRDSTASRDELVTSGQKLCSLQHQLQDCEKMISDLQNAITSHKRHEMKQKRDLDNSKNLHSAVVNELEEAKQNFVEATDLHQRTTQNLDNERQSVEKLKTTVAFLETNLQQAQTRVRELESAQQDLEKELIATQSLKNGFAESSTRLQQQLDTEKARSGKVEAALRKNLAESADKIANMQRFTGLLMDKMKENQNTSGQKITQLQKQLSSLEAILKHEKEKTSALEVSLQEVRAKSEEKVAGLESSILQLREEMANVNDAFAEKATVLQSQAASLEKALAAEKQRSSALELSLQKSQASSEERAAQLQTSIVHLRSELALARDTSAQKAVDQQTELTGLEGDLQIEKEHTSALEVSRHNQKVEFEGKFAELQGSSAELKTELKNAKSASGEQVLRLQSDILSLEHQLLTAKDQASVSQAAHDSHKTVAQSKVALLEASVAGLQELAANTSASADGKAEKLEANLIKLEKALQIERDQHSTLQKSHANLKAEADAKIQTLENAVAESCGSLAKAISASSQNATSLQSRIFALERDVQAERHRASVLEASQKDQFAESESKTARLESISAELRQTLTSTQSKHEGQVKSLEVQLERTQIAMVEAEKDHQQKYAELLEAQEDARRALNESMESHATTTAALEQERGKVANIRAELASNQDRVAMLDGLLSKARNEAQVSETSVAKLNEIRYTLRSDLDAAHESNRHLSCQLSKVNTARVALQEQLDTVSHHRTNLETELISTRASREELEKDLASGRDEADLYKIFSSSTATKINNLETQLASLESQLSESSAREKDVIKRAEAADNHIDELRNNLVAVQNNRQELENEQQQYKERIAFLEQAERQLEEDLHIAQRELEEVLENNRTLKAELCDSKATIIGLQAQKAEIKNELLDVQSRSSQHEATTRTNFSRLQVEKNYIAAELKSARSRASQLEAEKDDMLATLHAKILSLNSDNTRIAEELQIARYEASRSTAANDGLVDQLHFRLCGLESHNAQIAGELDSTRARVSQIEAEKAALRQTHELKISSLERDIHHITEELQYARSKASNFEAEKSHLSLALGKEIADLQSDKVRVLEDHKQIQIKASNLEMVKNRLAGELDDARTAKVTLQEQHLSILQQSEAANSCARADSKALSDQLKRSQAIRNSHHTALSAIRVQLGTAKMAKRSVSAKLNTAEKDLAILQRKNTRLEVELQHSVNSLTKSEGVSQAWESEVVRLRDEHADLSERLSTSEETCSNLRSTISALESRATGAKNEFSQLQQALQASEAEIVGLKHQIEELHKQHQEDLQTIQQRDAQVVSLRQQIHTKDATLSENDDVIAEQTSQISSLEDRAAAAELRVQTLKSELRFKEAEAAQLQQANDEYTSLMSPLQDEIKELRACKAALEQIVHTVKHVEGHSRLPLQHFQGKDISYADREDECRYYGGSNSVGGDMRPMSGETRVGTSHSNRSSKALRTLGIVDSSPTTSDKERRPRLYELWEDERFGAGGKEGPMEGPMESPTKRSPRRLTRKKREEQSAREKKEHGRLYNLAHFGSLDRPQFIRRAESRAEFHNLRK